MLEVSTGRSRNGVTSRKECVVGGQMAEGEQGSIVASYHYC